ncbi:MAG TPA: 3-hydroxyacyl-CoA dehydrogenase NAD-binding domain-containing protein [Puia sp.]
MPEKKEITEKYPQVTVIGAGTIGISWAALFLANGLKVAVNDPRPDLEEATLKGIGEMSHTLKSLGYDDKEITKNLSFEKDLDRAVKGADIIQENGPENIDFKQDLYARIETNVKSSALVLSSSSGITSSLFTKKMKDAGRVLIGHPFNPPHIIPLVEVVPGARTTKEAIGEAMQFYRSIGKKPVLIEKELQGFVANRLQAALFRECVYLVSTGVVSMENLDLIVSSSIGLRWAAAGPFKTFTLGGGPDGLPHFLAHLGPGLEQLWAVLGNPHLDQPTNAILIRQVNDSYGKIPFQELSEERDEQQLSVLKALGK